MQHLGHPGPKSEVHAPLMDVKARALCQSACSTCTNLPKNVGYVQEALRLKEAKAVDEVIAVSLGPQHAQVCAA